MHKYLQFNSQGYNTTIDDAVALKNNPKPFLKVAK